MVLPRRMSATAATTNRTEPSSISPSIMTAYKPAYKPGAIKITDQAFAVGPSSRRVDVTMVTAILSIPMMMYHIFYFDNND